MLGRKGKTLLAVGAVFAAASLLPASSALAVDFPADGASLGAIPDSPAGGNLCGDFTGAPRDVTFAVAGLSAGAPTDVAVSFTLAVVGTGGPGHPWAGDLDVDLLGPGGAPSQNIFSQTKSTTATGCGDDSNVTGPYTFSDSAPTSPSWWEAATTAGSAVPIAAGSYRASTAGGVVDGGANTLITPTFAGLANPNGTWTLRFRDGGQGDTGTVTAASLTIAPSHVLTVQAGGSGTGTVTGPGIACGADCEEPYAEGTAVVLEATPDTGSAFAKWLECSSVEGNKCTVSMTSDKTVKAEFSKNPAATPKTSTQSLKVKTDGTPPETAIGTHPKAKSRKRKAKFTFTSTEAGSTFKCKLDKGQFKACASPFEKKVSLGKHNFEVVAADAAGNADQSPAQFKFKVKPKAKKAKAS